MAEPQIHIDRIAVDAQANGQINLNAFLSGIASNCTLNAFVTDTNNIQLGGAFPLRFPPGSLMWCFQHPCRHQIHGRRNSQIYIR